MTSDQPRTHIVRFDPRSAARKMSVGDARFDVVVPPTPRPVRPLAPDRRLLHDPRCRSHLTQVTVSETIRMTRAQMENAWRAGLAPRDLGDFRPWLEVVKKTRLGGWKPAMV